MKVLNTVLTGLVITSIHLSASFSAWAETTAAPGNAPGTASGQVVRQAASGAGNPFNSYMGAVAGEVILIGFLVACLLIGGMLVLNLGFLSKRIEDRTGGRNPSDVGILKHTMWPEEQPSKAVFPAEEEDSEKDLQKDLKKPAA